MRCRCRPASPLAQLRLAIVGIVVAFLTVTGCAATDVRQTARFSAATCDRLPIYPMGTPVGKPVHRLRVLQVMTLATASDAACWSALREQACALGADAVIDAEIQQRFRGRRPVLVVTGTAVMFIGETALQRDRIVPVSTRPGARRGSGAQVEIARRRPPATVPVNSAPAARPPQTQAPTPAPPRARQTAPRATPRDIARFIDGSPVPAQELLAARVLALVVALEQLRHGLPPRYGPALDFVAEHLDRLTDLLAGAEEYPAEADALRKSVAVGSDLALYALDLLVAEARPGVGFARHQRLEFALSWCWEGMRELRSNPFWVDQAAQHARRVHLEAGHYHDQNLAGDERAAWNQTGVQAALLASGAYGLAQLAGALPRLFWVGQASLARLGAWLSRALTSVSEPGGGGLLFVTPEGSIHLGVLVQSSRASVVLTTSVVLTEAEVAALAALGKLGRSGAQLYFAAHVGSFGGTPAQQARARGLSGTNSVGGTPAPGFRSSQKWDTSRNADQLRENLKARGDHFVKDDQVHHIVPSTHREGERARELLDRMGIDINSADNGVVLAGTKHHGCGLHSFDTIREVTNRLLAAERESGRRAVLATLREIAQEIRAGTFPVPYGAP